MSDFCQQCSIAVFGDDFRDLAGLLTPIEAAQGYGVRVLCEGCGDAFVDDKGRCHSHNCLKAHGTTMTIPDELEAFQQWRATQHTPFVTGWMIWQAALAARGESGRSQSRSAFDTWLASMRQRPDDWTESDAWNAAVHWFSTLPKSE